MYAVIRTGGKQYKVAENDVIKVERMPAEAGASVALADVLALHDGTAVQIGSPLIEGAVVTADVLEQSRADKIIVFKKKRRQNYRRKAGHRQLQTVLRITGILPDGKPAKAAGAKTAKAAATRPGKADAAAADANTATESGATESASAQDSTSAQDSKE